MPALPAKLIYSSVEEEADFLEEVRRLAPALYLAGERPAHLLFIYRRLAAELSPFAQKLRQAASPGSRPPLLQPWLASWTTETGYDESLYEVLLFLDARGLEAAALQQLFLLPGFLRSPDDLGLLRTAPLPAIHQWSELMASYLDSLDQLQLKLAHRLILETFFHEAGQFAANEELVNFLNNFLAPLQEKFPEMDLLGEVLRLADWFQLWVSHQRKEVPNLPQDHAYYSLDFATIFKYLPRTILWNNGIPYRDGEKAFHYYSQEFYWLATGGSLRKIPDHPPYSKRMAKEFLALPGELQTGDADLYCYCFLLSLAAPHDLAMALLRFFRRPADLNALADWKARLDPVVQKLREANYHWESGQGDHLLGYLRHAVRDQFGFAINVRPIEQLEQEATAYYERMAVRRAEAERRRAERDALRIGAERKDSWSPLRGVSPWTEEGDQYSPVRRWKIVELNHRHQLEAESAQMRHCVSSYFQKCRHGQASIWSLRELRQNGTWYSLATIEIIPRQRRITQISARLNAQPNANLLNRIKNWAAREGLDLDSW